MFAIYFNLNFCLFLFFSRFVFVASPSLKSFVLLRYIFINQFFFFAFFIFYLINLFSVLSHSSPSSHTFPMLPFSLLLIIFTSDQTIKTKQKKNP